MKVVHLVQSANTSIGGSLTVARALVKAQRALGLDAWMICLYESNESHEGRLEEEASGFEIRCSVMRASRWTKGVRALRKLIQRLRPDIIHHHDGILWPRLATLGLGIPRITHGHLGAPKAGFFAAAQWTHRFTMATTSRLIAISAWVADSWEASGMLREKMVTIPNGVDAERFYRRPEPLWSSTRAKMGVQDHECLLIWVGRLDRETKGLDRLVTIAGLLDPNVRLVVAGTGADHEWLSSTLKLAGARRPALLIGQLEDPGELFGCADAFLFTSRVEPFGLVLLEATCSGLPIYACECEGGARELLEELRAHVVADSELASLASAISNRALSVSEEIIQVVRDRYSWTTVAQAISQVYATVTLERN